jgi:regulator of sigma E protease
LDLLTHFLLPFGAILLGLLIIHEAGHYFTAKMFGVKVEEAGVGLPPKLWGFRWRDTDYTINAIPIGAFVRMKGEEDPNEQDGTIAGDSLAAQAKWKRVIIIGSGAAINLVAAIVLMSLSLMVPHEVSEGGAQIGSVAPNSPAEQAGLAAGDEIYAINGRRVHNTSDAGYLIRLNRGETMTVTVKRDNPRAGGSEFVDTRVYARWDPPAYQDDCGVEQPQGPTGITIGAVALEQVNLTADEKAQLERDNTKALKDYREQLPANAPAWCGSGAAFGFHSIPDDECAELSDERQAKAQQIKQELFADEKYEYACYEFDPGAQYMARTKTESLGPIAAFSRGTRLSFESIIFMRNLLWAKVRGFDSDGPVTGPVGIAQATGEVVEEAGYIQLIALAGSLSMSLAVLNFLPIPAVDGGRLFFIFIEFIRGGRRIAPQKEALVHLAGFAALIMLAAVVTYFDILRLVNGDSLLR